jgi:hypothetical protein
MKRILGVLGVLSLVVVGAARPAAQSATLNGELLKDWFEMKSTIMKLANEMPADKYSFKAPPQRDFAQQALTNAFLGPWSRARVIYFLLRHTWDICGQMVVYLRENGGVPPASQRP